MTMRGDRSSTMYGHRGVFWAGVVAVTAGVTLHLPMYVEARDMGYHLAGMPVDSPMAIGMVLIIAGLAASVWGLIPRQRSLPHASDAHLRVRALDEVSISSEHVALMLVMAVPRAISTMPKVIVRSKGMPVSR